MRYTIYATVLLAMMTASAAFADTIVWKDPVQGFTISYPDSWDVQTPDSPYTRLRVAAPLAPDLATCKVKAQEDGRIKIYPKDLVDEAVSRELDRDFWDGEVAQYAHVQITEFYDPASLGNKGDATGVRISFLQDDGTDTVPMYGILLGSLYHGKRYIAACSARAKAYDRHAGVFASILDSIELDSRYHPFAAGYYRDFLADPNLDLPRTKPGTTTERTKQGFWDRLFMDKYHK